ncbi:hypothetical protein F4X90_18630, partial [Candidatus Poribacteria bacterium]|nr:hypothetical protein [Candidatus Poribacteria bacterium]
MKTIFIITLFFLFVSFPPDVPAQDYTNLNLPEGVKLRIGKGRITAIAYSPDSNQFAVASTVGIWKYDALTGEELNFFMGHKNRISSMCYSPDGKTIASGSWDNT